MLQRFGDIMTLLSENNNGSSEGVKGLQYNQFFH